VSKHQPQNKLLSPSELFLIRIRLARNEGLTTQDAWQDRLFAPLGVEPRPTYADLSLCYHNEATGPTSYVFCLKEFGYASDQILPARRLETYKYNSVMRAGLKLADIRKIQVLGD